MAIRKEDTTLKLKDIQIGRSWFPVTLAEPHSINQQLIWANWSENHLVQANVLKTERLTQANLINLPNFAASGSLLGTNLLKNPYQTVPACYDWTSSISGNTGLNTLQEIQAANSYIHVDNSRCFDTRQASQNANYSSLNGNNLFSFDSRQASQGRVDSHVYGEDSCFYKFAIKDSDQWTISFGNSLQQAHVPCTTAADYAAKQNDFIAAGRSSVTQFQPQNDNRWLKTSIENYSKANLDSMLGAEFKARLNSIPDFLRAPRMIADAALGKSMSSWLEPITPEKTNTAEYRHESAMSVIKIGEMPTAQDEQRNKTTRDEVKGFHKRKDHSKLASNQLCTTTFTQLQENYKPDKGGNKEADWSKTPQQKPRRRKHRPKVIIEGLPKSTPKPRMNLKNKPAKPTIPRKTTRVKDTPLGKRKCERRKGIEKNEPKMEKGTTETSLISSRHTRSTSRRFLNFVLESQLRGESSSVAFELTGSANRVWEDYLSMPERHFPSPLLCTKMDPVMDDHMLRNQSVCTRGKCQIGFTDITHDKEANAEQVTVNPRGEQTPKSPSDANSSSTCLTQERQVGGLKRHHTEKNDGTPGIHFPAIYKRRRTQRGHNRAISSLNYTVISSDYHVKLERQSLRDSCTKLFTSSSSQESSIAQSRATHSVNDNLENDGTQNKQQISEDLIALGPTKWIKKKRSKIPTRARDLASLRKICKELPSSPSKAATKSRIGHNTEILCEHTCMEALVADLRPKMTTKKRSQRSMLINQTFNNHHKFAYISTGSLLPMTWKRDCLIDSVIEKLNQLDLNAKSSQQSAQKQNAFMPYHMHYEEQHALVPYQRGGAIVPFDSLSDQVRRRQPRPKVDLDDETTRVWKLLLENINSEGIGGTDEENRKWWEEERRVLSGRADSFIARMHLIQGDRRFSPWKGSVVDSVVGVFLTQNVSDHLSSSAFMSLAAHFPFKSKTNLAGLHDDTAGIKVKKPEVSVLDPDEAFRLNEELLNRTVCGEDPEILQEFECDEMVNNVESGHNLDGIIPEDESGGLSSDISKNVPVMSFESVAIKPNLKGDRRYMDDALYSQQTGHSPIVQASERTESFLLSNSEENPISGIKPNRFSSITSFVKLLQMAGTVLHGESEEGNNNKISDEKGQAKSERLTINLPNEDHFASPAPSIISCSKATLCVEGRRAPECSDLFQKNIKLTDTTSREELCAAEFSGPSAESSPQTIFQAFTAASFKEKLKFSIPNSYLSDSCQIEINKNIVDTQMEQIPANSLSRKNKKTHEASNICTQNVMDLTGSSSNTNHYKMSKHKEVNSNKNDHDYHPRKPVKGPKAKGERSGKEKQNTVDWDSFRKQAQAGGKIRERTANTIDSVDWNAVKCADVNEISQTIKERGMNNVLAKRIKDFLNRLVRDHGSIDLEWLRDVPPDNAKEYLLSIRGLGLKSVECVRLLTLHQLAFPVDTNVGRIAVRLGWVPLQPLPESLQLHLLELYPVLESIQKYLWPRLCKLDQRTLYELHYQMITFGKVFCTKSKPNCNACPMRGECRHFASAFASSRFALPAPEEKSIVSATENKAAYQNSIRSINTLELPLPLVNQKDAKTIVSNPHPIIEEPDTQEPIIEVPATPEPGYTLVPEFDIEDTFCEDPGEIPTIQLNMEEFTHNLQEIIQQNTELQEGDMSKALVALTSETASIPAPKLKNVSRLRTEHQVYELPDSHPLLEGMDKREQDDPCPYLLAIWTPGETLNSVKPPERWCASQDSEKLCTNATCLSCNGIREANSQTVRGTLLIPCRTAMRGSFPLNGTYFQVNEVFSDHESSLNPMDVPREWLWNLPRRTVYFGTSIPTIFKGLSTEGIQYCFWRGFICVRGFDRITRAPRPLIARFHFPVSKLAKGKGLKDEDET